MAFFPGKIVKTNQFLVLLGENWFVERSASQTVDIIDRRLESKINNSRIC
jgi:prefoldin subunit 5